MRRRRQTLQVSTFPFLAVLLCTMGSLILVLLIIDRRGREAALQRAQEEAAQQVAKAAGKATADHENEQRLLRAAWEEKRQKLHTRLLTEQEQLQAQMNAIRRQLSEAAARLRYQAASDEELRQKVQAKRSELHRAETVLTSSRSKSSQAAAHADSSNRELRRMTADLLQLQQVLADLKTTRQKAKQTYSVVPYRGRRGESRRPLYIECTARGVIFHPERLLVPVTEHSYLLGGDRPSGEPRDVRQEVVYRIGKLKERMAASGLVMDKPAYLLLLVRPDGIENYYRLQAALKDLTVSYGYELIDADWVLDFPADDAPSREQPWQVASNPAVAPSTSRSDKPPRGLPQGQRPGDGADPQGGAMAAGPPGSSGPGGGGELIPSRDRQGAGSFGASGGGDGQSIPSRDRQGAGSFNPSLTLGARTNQPAAGPGMPLPRGISFAAGGPRGSSTAGTPGTAGSGAIGNNTSGFDGRPGGMPSLGGSPGASAGPPGSPGLATLYPQPGGAGNAAGASSSLPGIGGGGQPGGSGSSSASGFQAPVLGQPIATSSGDAGGGGGSLASTSGTGGNGQPGAGSGVGTASPGGSSQGALVPEGGPAAPAGPPPAGQAGNGLGSGPANGSGVAGSYPVAWSGQPPAPPGAGMPGVPGQGGSPAAAGAVGTLSASRNDGGPAGPTSSQNGPPGGPYAPGASSSAGPAGAYSGGRSGAGTPPQPGAAPTAEQRAEGRDGTGQPSREPGGEPGQPGREPGDGSGTTTQRPPSSNRPRRRRRSGPHGIDWGQKPQQQQEDDDDDDEEPPPGAMPTPGGDPPPRPRPRALRAARINGNREWLIYIECRYEGAVLYPSQQRFTLAQLELPAANNPLWLTLWHNIQRKQALVRPGETPYRPQIRFLVRQDGMRAFHTADSLLETLRIPRAWQALNWNDDVNAIMDEGR